jgi:hypothetical protein
MAALADRDKIEADFARKLSRVQSRHRHELETLLGTPPDPANVPQEFWDKVEKETKQEILSILLLIFIGSHVQHSGIDSEDSRFLAQVWASGRAGDVAKRYTLNSVEWLSSKAEKWQAEIKQGKSPDVTSGLLQIFGPERAERVAITETTAAATAGSETAVIQNSGLSDDDLWITEDDEKVCPICSPLHLKPRSVWSLKFPQGPPAHVRCRCYIRYA